MRLCTVPGGAHNSQPKATCLQAASHWCSMHKASLQHVCHLQLSTHKIPSSAPLPGTSCAQDLYLLQTREASLHRPGIAICWSKESPFVVGRARRVLRLFSCLVRWIEGVWRHEGVLIKGRAPHLQAGLTGLNCFMTAKYTIGVLGGFPRCSPAIRATHVERWPPHERHNGVNSLRLMLQK